MCGVTGLLSLDGVEPARPDLGLLRAMTDTLAHRGPDGEGFWSDGPIALGHRRLAIIDLAGSPQPMTTPDGRFTIVFNGEIVNYRVLRSSHGLACRTDGDTEVLLLLLAKLGARAIPLLRGQFAFALWDRVEEELLLARDRMGILPLYWTRVGRSLGFASEIKALRPLIGQLDIDRDSLAELLFLRAVPAPNTLVAGVHKVLPAHTIRFRRDGKARIERYWDPSPIPVRATTPALAVEELDRRLHAAVEESMVADVPVGAYLSGGVDSSLIVSLAARFAGAHRLKTFTAGFNTRDDERGFAERVSRHIGTDHHTVVVQPTDFLSEVAKLTAVRDAPVSETSDVAVAALARLASEHVTVVLSGEGSDELFAGYPKYRAVSTAGWIARVPGVVTSALVEVGRRSVGRANPRADVALRALSGRTEWERLASWFSSFAADEVEMLTRRRLRGPPPGARELRGDAVRRLGLIDCAAWLPDNLLERGDRMTMASSIELRPPFLDPRVVDFAFGLPSNIKVHRGQTKWIVKEVARKYVPRDLVDRPKNGFKVPLGSWLRGELHDAVRSLVLDDRSAVAPFVDLRTVRRLLDDHRAAKADRTKEVWALLTLELFLRHVIAKPVSVAA
jgi:asparagine synthase (glutamine-hydrolysing)